MHSQTFQNKTEIKRNRKTTATWKQTMPWCQYCFTLVPSLPMPSLITDLY